MDTTDRHAGNVLLLRVGMLSLLIALVLAWCLIFVGLMRLDFAVATFHHVDKLLSAHLDFLMMTMLLLGFYAVKKPIAAYARIPMAIGSITNPLCFLIESVYPEHPPGWFVPFAMTSVTLTTIGYGMASIIILRWTLRE